MTLALVFRFLHLWLQTSRLPDVQPNLVIPTVIGAMHAETDEYPAELLIAIAWGESRLDPTVRTGVVCGILQVNPTDINRPRSDCDVWSQSAEEGIQAGVIEMDMLRADSRVRGDLQLALLYRACGNAAFDGTCRKTRWPEWVIDRARCLQMSDLTWHVDTLGRCVRTVPASS